MKKFITLAWLLFAAFGIAEPYRDSRGVLFMNEDEWVKFYNKDGQDIVACLVIGSMIMEESYLKDGKKMTHTLEEVQKGIKDFNKMIGETGLRDIYGGTDKIHEFYYASICKKPTQKEFDLVGSPTFKKEMNRIFEIHKVIEK